MDRELFVWMTVKLYQAAEQEMCLKINSYRKSVVLLCNFCMS